MANAGRPTRDLNLSHPASYTALTRTKLVPARRALAQFRSLGPPKARWGIQRCEMLCSFSKWQRFPSNWKPAANTDVLFGLELVTPLRHRLGSHAAIFLTYFHFKNLVQILFTRHGTVSFFLALSNRLSVLEPFKDSFSVDLLRSFSLSLLSFHYSTRLRDTALCPILDNDLVNCEQRENCAGMTNVTRPV